MDTTTLTVPVDVATEALADYKAMPMEDRTVEDRAIIKAYEAITRGQDVISLSDTICAAGMFDEPSGPRRAGLPKLAIARAHAPEVYIAVSGRDLLYSSSDRLRWPGSRTHRLVTETSVVVRRARPERAPYVWGAGTLVPSIPAKYRPKPDRLHLFHILWEVDEWNLVPPGDPALLKHLAGDMWAVLAQWDLTPIERAAMERGRLR